MNEYFCKKCGTNKHIKFGVTWPRGITVPATVPTNWDGTQKVTYMGGERIGYDGEIVELGKCIKAQATCPDYTPKVTCSGVEHAYKQATGVDA